MSKDRAHKSLAPDTCNNFQSILNCHLQLQGSSTHPAKQPLDTLNPVTSPLLTQSNWQISGLTVQELKRKSLGQGPRALKFPPAHALLSSTWQYTKKKTQTNQKSFHICSLQVTYEHPKLLNLSLILQLSPNCFKS